MEIGIETFVPVPHINTVGEQESDLTFNLTKNWI